MSFFILIAAGIAFIVSPLVRCAVLHLFATVKNGAIDSYYYFRHKKYNLCHTGELVAYVGLFGKGKTLSVVHEVIKKYKRCNNRKVWCMRRKKFVTQKVKVISNVSLKIPYEEFQSLEQIVLCAENNQAIDDANDTLTVTLVLGDEFSVQMNSRSFKTNIDPLFLNTLLTCRHYHMSLFYTAQRFGHVDALLRQVTSYVVDCNKIWRFQRQNYYSAWEMENAQNPQLIKPEKRKCWFVFNRDYEAYDTYACVGNLTKEVRAGNMMSSQEILDLQRNEPVNMDAVQAPTKRWSRKERKRHKIM
ncbi:MAG: hypothetical protein LBR76_05340 [Oscillospiraceae bacterium]|jgi:hypothetical protein|nr:hypothetical protein [Oscillospiraceae bacterium]